MKCNDQTVCTVREKEEYGVHRLGNEPARRRRVLRRRRRPHSQGGGLGRRSGAVGDALLQRHQRMLPAPAAAQAQRQSLHQADVGRMSFALYHHCFFERFLKPVATISSMITADLPVIFSQISIFRCHVSRISNYEKESVRYLHDLRMKPKSLGRGIRNC